MFGIGKIDLSGVARNAFETVNTIQEEDWVGIKDPSVPNGQLLLSPIQIPMAVQWEGFDIIGSGVFEVSIRRPALNGIPADRRSYDPIARTWIASTVEVFYPEAKFRDYFRSWTGAFQLGLRMTSIGAYPATVKAIHYGYHTIGEFFDYLIKFQLSQFLSVSASILRTVRINGSRFPIPKGFDPIAISNPRAYEVAGGNADKPLTISGGEFVLSAPAIDAVHHIYFEYSVPIDSNNEHIPQIENAPSIFFRNQKNGGLKFLNSMTYISIDRTTTRCLVIPYLHDLILDAIVFGDTSADANAVANKISAKIAETGGFWNPGFNHDCIVQLISPVVPSPSGGSVSSNPVGGMLFSNTLKLKLANLPYGAFYTDTARIEELNSTYNIGAS
jgi:hypothetical protein